MSYRSIKNFYGKRPSWSHKGDFGYVLVVGGSNRYSGSPAFNALAALRSGADLITIIGPRRSMDIVASFSPDLITEPLEGELDKRDVSRILSLAENFDALIIGGGLARTPRTYDAIRQIIRHINLPLVIDAEAIRAVASDRGILNNKRVALTPHAEEFRILAGEGVGPEIKDRQAKVFRWAKKLGTTILLKGHIDVISDGKSIYLNKSGSPYMTKGGCGDTLAGICGALLARGATPYEALSAAAWINGKAGEAASKKFGEGTLASDILQFIPQVITKYRRF